MATVVCPSCICVHGLTQQPTKAAAAAGTRLPPSAGPLLSSSFSAKQSWKRREEKEFLSHRSGQRPASCWAHLAIAVNTASVTNEVATTTPLGLEVVETNQPNCRVQLRITVPASLCQTAYDEVIREFSKKAKIPGFRPGKRVPENVLVNYIGPAQVRSSALEAILKKTLPEALSSVAGRALKESEHITSRFQDLEKSFSPDAPLSYDVAVDVAPEVTWTSENAYKNLKVTVELESNLTPEQAAHAEFRSRLKDLGSLRVAEDRPLEMGDVAIIDVGCNRINADGTLGDKVLSAEQKGFQLDTDEGADFLPGFIEALVGIKREETREFDLHFPQTWQQEALRGIHARFTGYCKEIFVRVLPEVDDSVAAKLVEGCTSVQQVRAELLKKHQTNMAQAKKQATHAAVAEELAKVVVVDVPNSLLEEQGRQMYAAKLMELQASAKLSKEQVISLSSQEMVTNFLQAQKEKIMDSVKQTLAVAEIYKLENLQYSEDELNTEVETAIAEFKRYNQDYDDKKVREQAAELLEGSKVLDWLVATNQVEYNTLTIIEA